MNEITLCTGEILKQNEYGVWVIQEHEMAIELTVDLIDVIKELNKKLIKIEE